MCNLGQFQFFECYHFMLFHQKRLQRFIFCTLLFLELEENIRDIFDAHYFQMIEQEVY